MLALYCIKMAQGVACTLIERADDEVAASAR